MLHFLGDTHTQWAGLLEFDKLLWQRAIPGPHTIIQVGDFGWYPEALEHWIPLRTPVYAIDGNHEDYRLVRTFAQDRVTQVRPNLFYVPRGLILTLDGVTRGFAGGAGSVDAAWRKRGHDWWPEEEVLRRDQLGQLLTIPVDVLVTHTPPASVIRACFPPLNLDYWGLPKGWRDPSQDVVEELWNVQAELRGGTRPFLYCGHMHKTVPGREFRILGISEFKTHDC